MGIDFDKMARPKNKKAIIEILFSFFSFSRKKYAASKAKKAKVISISITWCFMWNEDIASRNDEIIATFLSKIKLAIRNVINTVKEPKIIEVSLPEINETPKIL